MVEMLCKWIFKSPILKTAVNGRNISREQRNILREIGMGGLTQELVDGCNKEGNWWYSVKDMRFILKSWKEGGRPGDIRGLRGKKYRHKLRRL